MMLALFASTCWADFGEYRSHALDGNTLTIQSSRGELRITAVDNAAFEVHYVEDGVKQLPSFALAPANGEHAVDVEETDAALSFVLDGITAVIDKTPVRIAFERDGAPLVAEEHGYFAYETTRGFRFALDNNEKILGGGQRVLGMDRRGHRLPLYNKASYGYTTEANPVSYTHLTLPTKTE